MTGRDVLRRIRQQGGVIVRQRLADFEQRYNATARPFQWKFTPADLHDLLHRIDQHQTTTPTIPQAA